MLPTPNAWDGMRGPRSQKNLKEKNHQINLITALKDNESKKPVHQWMLENKKMYPTPRTGAGSRPNGKGGKVLEEEVMIEAGLRERGKKLKQMYPTPAQRDYKDTTVSNSYQKRNSDSLPVKMMKENKVGGKLNPQFVQFLMGYPMNWTKIE